MIYHRVLSKPDPLRPDEIGAAEFESQMAALARCFNVLPLDEAVARMQKGSLPARSACVTFDDGYADNHDIALPILKRWHISATFFITTGYLDGGRMWNDTVIESIRRSPAHLDLCRLDLGTHVMDTDEQRLATARSLIHALKYRPSEERERLVTALAQKVGAQLPDDLMMSTEQIRVLCQAGMTVGGHTVSHPILQRLDEATARAEIATGKEVLEGILREPVLLFAYPNGTPSRDYGAGHVQMVKKAGFVAAVSTAWGAARTNSDIYQLPRFTPWDRTPSRFVLRLYNNLRSPPFAVV